MKKLAFIIFVLFFFTGCYAQKNELEKITLKFEMFKFPDSKYSIDLTNNELTCTETYPKYHDDTISFNKKYRFTKKDSEKLVAEFNTNIPDSDVLKAVAARDGGGFLIKFFKKDGTVLELDVMNMHVMDAEKYKDELNKLDAFFEFAYSVVKDSEGIKVIDRSYMPYFRGLPIRKVSDNPLEYIIWGRINGDMATNKAFKTLLDNLPNDRCVIVDCDNGLSYALQEDILRLYIINDSNLKFANNGYLKYTRENLIELRNEIERSEKENTKFERNNKDSVHRLYFSNPERMNQWLELPVSQLDTSIETIRKNCQ